MRRRVYIIIVAAVAVAAAAVIIASVSGKRGESARQPRTVRAERGNIVIKVTESGVVAPLTVVNVKSELAGEVKQLFVEEGDSVRAGDRLALVQQESSQAQQIAQARASVERAKLDLTDAERNLERQRDLFERDFIAKKDVEDAEQTYKRSQIQYELAEKQLWVVLGGGAEQSDSGGLGAKAFDNITVTSPISGVVISLDVEQGEMITSGTQAYGGGGTVLMTIADLSKMVVTTDVNEVDVGKIRVGQPAQIGFDAIRNRVYNGVVKRIAPAGTVSGNVVVFPVEVEITGAAGAHGRGGTGLIKPGMTADLDIIIARAESVVYVPKETIINQGGGPAVMLLQDGKEILRPVTAGLEDEVDVEIKDGLQEGDEVLIANGRPASSQQQQARQSQRGGGPPR
jgi:HlyD family secretion protein